MSSSLPPILSAVPYFWGAMPSSPPLNTTLPPTSLNMLFQVSLLMCRSIVTPLPTNLTCTNCWVFQVSKEQQVINQTILQGSQVTLYFDAFQIINFRNSWGSCMDLQWEREYATNSKYLCRKDLQWGSNSDCASGEPPHYFCPTGAVPWHIQDT